MPLNNRFMDAHIISTLRDMPYQEKAAIYDERCVNCGFCLIVVHYNNTVIHYKCIGDAVEFMINNITATMERTCDYPTDICISSNGNIYPTLTEIVMNGCDFWRDVHVFADDETEFIEIEVDNSDDGEPNIRKSISCETISQPASGG